MILRCVFDSLSARSVILRGVYDIRISKSTCFTVVVSEFFTTALSIISYGFHICQRIVFNMLTVEMLLLRYVFGVLILDMSTLRGVFKSWTAEMLILRSDSGRNVNFTRCL